MGFDLEAGHSMHECVATRTTYGLLCLQLFEDSAEGFHNQGYVLLLGLFNMQNDLLFNGAFWVVVSCVSYGCGRRFAGFARCII